MLQFFYLEDAYRTLIGKLLIDSVLYKRTGAQARDSTIETNAYGKPFFPDYPFIQYNISHSGDYVACAVHDEQVGIDVEKVQSFDLLMAKQLFTGFEYRDILDAKNSNLACYDIWTLKESYVKALGKGLAIPIHSFRVRKTGGNQIEVIDVDRNEAVKGFVWKQYTIAADYKLAVCARGVGKIDFGEHPEQIPFDYLRDGAVKNLNAL